MKQKAVVLVEFEVDSVPAFEATWGQVKKVLDKHPPAPAERQRHRVARRRRCARS